MSASEEQQKPLIDVEGGTADGSGRLSSAKRVVAKFANQNKRFKANATMALAIASYMTVFGLPVYSETVSLALFGQKDALVGVEVVEMCGPNKMGFKVNIGNETNPILVNFNSTHVQNGIKPDAWCGFLPGAYFEQWPTVVQTAMFTLYGTTGSTVKNAWQCISGTFFAVANLYIMTFIYPGGASDSNYNPVVAWLDLVFVLFLFLASRADVNTMMMGMCSTVCLMLHFMDPNTGPTIGTYESAIPFLCWDGETSIALLTNIMGCVIAIMATIFPKPLLNITHMHDDAIEVINGVEHILRDCIEYYDSNARDPRRFQIFGKIAALKGTITRVGTHLEASFWETFNLGRSAKTRELYASFNLAMANTEDVMYSIKSALLQLDFNEMHNNIFREALRNPLKELCESTLTCLRACARCCKDGQISAEEKKEIANCVSAMRTQQQALSDAFQHAAKESKDYISEDVAPDSLFVFSISQLASELQDWAEDLDVFENKWRRKACCDSDTNICAIAAKQFTSLFDADMFKIEQLRFFLMNAIPILAGFAISMYSKGSVFVQYSSTMPAMLSLLVSYESGATFFTNLQKLMGVTFGHTMPLLVMSVIDYLPCDSMFRFVMHATSIFVYYATFTFMYYASEQWSTIGIMIGAFGCFMLFRPCESHIATDNSAYASHYKDIAEVIIAMMLKMTCAYIFSPTEPRDIATAKLEMLFNEILTAFEMLSTGKVEGAESVATCIKNAKGFLKACEEQAPKTDPKLQMVPGLRTNFKKDLYEGALTQARLVISDLDMLVLALHGHRKKHTLAHSKHSVGENMAELTVEIEGQKQEQNWVRLLTDRGTAWKTLDDDLKQTVSSSTAVCLAVLKHETEEPLDSEHVDKIRKISNLTRLEGLEDFYKDVSKAAKKEVTEEKSVIVTRLARTRILLAVNALALATQHCSEIAAQSFQHMLYF
mmetsp:Transcript_51643/g.148953  ORF Transcript_51643/g.148953 Transcript_51643/m.148953 type:complete len:943 (-) Transcript_51643:107-2935(-)